MADEKNRNILERGVADVIVRAELEKKLQSGKQLRIKFGIDPTGADLHIGHAVVLNKLRHFQDAGHICILLIGDYTARIGDPTGKSETRKMLSEDDIKANMKHYIEQAGKILDLTKLEVRYNSEWFGKMGMADLLELTAKRTVNQILQREDFKNRLAEEREISMVETLYPLMQGYDSVALNCDVEIGGTDQLFNMLVGRDLQRLYGLDKQQNVVTVPILEGLDGKEKMSKSLNNYIGITEPAAEIYGKTLSIPDELIIKYFKLGTLVPLSEIEALEAAMAAGENPKNVKMRLARELVTFYHDEAAAMAAEAAFEKVFAQGDIPEDIELVELPQAQYSLIELVAVLGMVETNSEGRRLIKEGAVKVNGEKAADFEAMIDLKSEVLVRVGKRKFKKAVYAG